MPRLPETVRVRMSYGDVQEWPVTDGGLCRYCHARIFWCKTLSSPPQNNPVNVDPETDGVHLSHFATCPRLRRVRRDYPRTGRDRAAGA